MALETVVFSQDPFSHSCCKDSYSFAAAWNPDDHGFLAEEEKAPVGVLINSNVDDRRVHATWDSNSSPEACTAGPSLISPAPSGRRKRRRTKSAKNKEDLESQRMTHIAVERNRRRQMNDYLAVLRSLMPPSYVQRGDQASIIGGAINFVKELEQLLQSMEGRRMRTKQQEQECGTCSSPFAEFFTFPQYSTHANQSNTSSQQWAVADIEVTMVDTHANLKILSKKRSGQLTKIVVGLQALRLTVLHLNVTTHDDMVLHSASVKLEDGCELNTVDEIAAAVHEIMRRIQEESPFC
ncbi:transcription factor bHLH96-like [Neltuma alba]|uniref:transcription factor bHLH96-like n=1 Tax=Neltuma alba TaxID=207710 RepID=UPI0010A3F662|nr:transcription factor bHLH96-like [Prosopis alba]XP_028792802.1 transcription factor bHLH96-like [Prosopis alba]